MIGSTPTSRGLALRQVAYPKLPSISQLCTGLGTYPLVDRDYVVAASEVSSASSNCSPILSPNTGNINSWESRPKDSLHFHIEQRLPPISDLLKGAPWPLGHVSSTPMGPPTPLPSPTGFSSYSHSQPSPTWQALPPRSQSASGQFPGHFHPTPQLRSLEYSTPRSFSVPGRSTGHRHSPDPQRRNSEPNDNAAKHLWRELNSPFARRRSPGPSDSDSDSPRTPNGRAPGANIDTTSRRRATRGRVTTATTMTTTTKTGAAAQRAEPMANTRRRRRNNKPYTFEQEAFLIYHRVDLHLTWGEVRAAFLARWPHLERTVGGLECIYYRTNAVLPATTPDGLLVLVDPAVEAGVGAGAGVGVGASAGPGEYGFGDEGKVGYKYYRGVAYRTLQVKCRAGEIPLMERFPEELVEEGNEWVKAEHRTAAMRLAQRRRLQREEWLASKTNERYARMLQL